MNLSPYLTSDAKVSIESKADGTTRTLTIKNSKNTVVIYFRPNFYLVLSQLKKFGLDDKAIALRWTDAYNDYSEEELTTLKQSMINNGINPDRLKAVTIS